MNVTQQRPTAETTRGLDNVNQREMENTFKEKITRKNMQRLKVKSSNESTYDEIFKQLKGTGKLWEDPNFKGSNEYEWKRPKDIDEDATLVFKGPNRFDVKQLVTTFLDRGHFLSALATFANREELFKNVVPDGQDFEENYIGAFRFRFWIFGKWHEVIVDDRLPTANDVLAFMYSRRDFEFWSPLAEKAYAKLYGSYDVIREVNKSEALQDLTGGLCETFRLNDKERPKDFHAQMLKFESLSSLMCCDMETPRAEIYERNGLISLHGHSITSVVEMKLNDGNIAKLIRIRNPWGSGNEWTNNWSDASKNWDKVSIEDKKKYHRKRDDGEFWMSFDDFVENFKNVVVCHLGQENIDKSSNDKMHWEIAVHEGAWLRNVNAGGPRRNIDYYVTNHQYQIEVIDPDKNDKDNSDAIIVSLTQIDRRNLNLRLYAIGYDIYKIKGPIDGLLNKEFFTSSEPLFGTTMYINKRDNSCRYTLPIGYYAIVPSTYYSKQEGKFLLRICSLKQYKSKEIDEKTEIIEIDKDSEYIIANTFAYTNDHVEKIFNKICGPTRLIDPIQLKNILNAIYSKNIHSFQTKSFEEFSLNDGKTIVTWYSFDRNGKLNCEELKMLLHNMRVFKMTFTRFDEDNNGFLKSEDYRQALHYNHIKVSNNIHRILVNRYADPDTGNISLKDFLMTVIRLSRIREIILQQEKDGMDMDYLLTD